jgi:hypothetical protein
MSRSLGVSISIIGFSGGLSSGAQEFCYLALDSSDHGFDAGFYADVCVQGLDAWAGAEDPHASWA